MQEYERLKDESSRLKRELRGLVAIMTDSSQRSSLPDGGRNVRAHHT